MQTSNKTIKSIIQFKERFLNCISKDIQKGAEPNCGSLLGGRPFLVVVLAATFFKVSTANGDHIQKSLILGILSL